MGKKGAASWVIGLTIGVIVLLIAGWFLWTNSVGSKNVLFGQGCEGIKKTLCEDAKLHGKENWDGKAVFTPTAAEACDKKRGEQFECNEVGIYQDSSVA